MTRTERLLRLARLRGDRLAIAVLEGGPHRHLFHWFTDKVGMWASCRCGESQLMQAWSESEMRAAWGDR